MFSPRQMLSLTARALPAALARPAGRPVALFFHGVEREATNPRVQVNHMAAGDFRRIAAILKRDFDVLPYAAMDHALRRPAQHRRAVFLMSDDGYANLFATGAPILAEFSLPWTLFVSTHHIDTGEPNPFLIARLFFHFAPVGSYRIPHYPAVVTLGESNREAAARQGIAWLRLSKAEQAIGVVRAMSASLPNLDGLLARFPSERFLSWQEVRALAAKGVEIGAHAHDHWAMSAQQSPSQLAAQARTAHARLTAELGKPPHAFAYPFGNVDDVSADAWRAVRDAGFKRAFTTLSGTLDAGRNPFLMPRFELNPREAHLASLVPLIRLANPRLVRWQKALSGTATSNPDPARAGRPVSAQAE